MSDTTQHCIECERLTAIVATMRTESGVLRRECKLRGDKVEQLEAEVAALRAERDDLRDELTECQRERDSWTIGWQELHAEVERMRPLYDAAIQRHAGLCGAGTMVTVEQADAKLKRLAVDAYRAASSEQKGNA